ncbi:MAG: hypothetical protein KJ597_01025 [Nanoarchaeota archaeon]|nr:hypothetical protein [Nanoarchaeota archaeon]MBU1622134.1 hypothetical protein [Nanoarchaeota archaeon]
MALSKEKTEEIVKKIEEAINRKTGQTGFKCPICTNDKFSLAGGFTNDFLMDRLGGGLVIGGPVLPSVPIVCTNCGNTFFLNARVLGLSEEFPKEEKKKEDVKKNE